MTGIGSIGSFLETFSAQIPQIAFKTSDTNGDGGITRSEFTEAAAAQAGVAFDRLDTDKSGSVNSAEFEAPLKSDIAALAGGLSSGADLLNALGAGTTDTMAQLLLFLLQNRDRVTLQLSSATDSQNETTAGAAQLVNLAVTAYTQSSLLGSSGSSTSGLLGTGLFA